MLGILTVSKFFVEKVGIWVCRTRQLFISGATSISFGVINWIGLLGHCVIRAMKPVLVRDGEGLDPTDRAGLSIKSDTSDTRT